MPEQKKCDDCGMQGSGRSLKESLLRPGKWVCKDKAACALRILIRIRGEG